MTARSLRGVGTPSTSVVKRSRSTPIGTTSTGRPRARAISSRAMDDDAHTASYSPSQGSVAHCAVQFRTHATVAVPAGTSPGTNDSIVQTSTAVSAGTSSAQRSIGHMATPQPWARRARASPSATNRSPLPSVGSAVDTANRIVPRSRSRGHHGRWRRTRRRGATRWGGRDRGLRHGDSGSGEGHRDVGRVTANGAAGWGRLPLCTNPSRSQGSGVLRLVW
ncbi:hypothetical protein P9139_17385 [Curtobacterium flaccumfaciens]|nr:hypothetical protein P9139_17385 [Curtobacterium flaccumfaciens]